MYGGPLLTGFVFGLLLTATAQPPWSDPVLLSSADDGWALARGRGGAAAALLHNPGGGFLVSTAALPSVPWSPPTLITTSQGDSTIAVSDAGDTLVVWCYPLRDSFYPRKLQVVWKPAGANWRAPITLTNSLFATSGRSGLPSVGIDASGNATPLFVTFNESTATCVLVAATVSVAGGNVTQTVLQQRPPPCWSWVVGSVNAAGAAVSAAGSDDGGTGTGPIELFSRSSPSADWVNFVLAPAVVGRRETKVAVGEDGSAVVYWIESKEDSVVYVASRVAALGEWSAPASPPLNLLTPLAVAAAVDDAGATVFAFQLFDDRNGLTSLYASSRSKVGVWAPLEWLQESPSFSNVTLVGLGLTMTPAGSAVIAVNDAVFTKSTSEPSQWVRSTFGDANTTIQAVSASAGGAVALITPGSLVSSVELP